MKYLFTSFIVACSYFSFSQLSIDVSTLGASTSLGDNAPYIQKAIDSVSSNGGGEVIINGGTFTSNTIILKSDVTLRVTSGTTLLALPVDTFPDIPYNTRSWMDTYTDKSLIFAEDANNIRITGGGTIDGNGTQTVYLLDSTDVKRRPFGMRIHGVDTFQVDSITLRQAPQWWGSIDSCQNVHIFNITVYNQGYSSNDGIDISSSTNVLVENSTFDTDDDPLPIKTESRAICRDVMVRNCQMATFERAVKVGCETLGPLVNIHFQDITVVPSSNTVVGAVEVPWNVMYIAVADGGSMDSIYFERINVQAKSQTSLFIRLCNRGFSYDGTHPGPYYLRNVFINDVTATQTGTIPNSITGISGFPVQNINLHNVVLTVPGGGTLGDTAVSEQIATRPEFQIWGDSLNAYGLYTWFADSINLDSVCIITQSYDPRPLYYFSDTNGVAITNPCSNPDVNGIKNITSVPSITYYPNPAQDQMTIGNIPSECEAIIFYDMRGALVAVVPAMGRTEMPINTSTFESGIYTAVAHGQNFHQVTKVVVAK